MGRIAPFTTFVNGPEGNKRDRIEFIFCTLLTNETPSDKMKKQMRRTGGSLFFPFRECAVGVSTHGGIGMVAREQVS